MSIAASAASAASVTQRSTAGTKAPITLAMLDRMIAAGVFEPPEDHPLELTGSTSVPQPEIAWVTFRRYETRNTFRDQATISPLALPTASLLPADLFPA